MLDGQRLSGIILLSMIALSTPLFGSKRALLIMKAITYVLVNTTVNVSRILNILLVNIGNNSSNKLRGLEGDF